MNYSISRWLLMCFSIYPLPLSGISMVYNFRISQITKQPILDSQSTGKNTLMGLIFDQFQKKYIGTSQNFAGGLVSYIYETEPYYVRTDFAASHIKEKSDEVTTFSGAATDDILFTFGRNFTQSPQSLMTLSGLFGIPTHNITTLRHVSFGYGQIGLGIQFDGSYELQASNALLYGTRYIYFVPRKTTDSLSDIYTFTIGNIIDLLLGYKHTWQKHGLEFGYTARFDFGANIKPHLDDIVEKTNYIKDSFYFVYKYKFLIKNRPNRLLFNIAYGFDQNPKIYSNKYIITIWGSWGVNF